MRQKANYLITIPSAKRIDARYWLINLKGKFYVVDYCNPRDIRNYFPLLFKENSKEWLMYDVSDFKSSIPTIETKFFNADAERARKANNIGTILSVSYIINIIFFPKFLNLAYITYDPRISENWKLVIGIILTSCILMFIFLFSSKQCKIPKEAKKYYLYMANFDELEATQISETKVEWYLRWFEKLPHHIKGMIAMIITIPICLLIGIGTSSYSQLIFFAIPPFIVFFFGKFLGFSLIDQRARFQIIESEEK